MTTRKLIASALTLGGAGWLGVFVLLGWDGVATLLIVGTWLLLVAIGGITR